MWRAATRFDLAFMEKTLAPGLLRVRPLGPRVVARADPRHGRPHHRRDAAAAQLAHPPARCRHRAA
ncbi:MAG: hypothetical protein MZW92_77620 [Comamonadaceae bacterium]|nr:hypothetical protein [Comamonadaceae bacterium]